MHANIPRFNSATHPRHAARAVNPAVPTSVGWNLAIRPFSVLFRTTTAANAAGIRLVTPLSVTPRKNCKFFPKPLDTPAGMAIMPIAIVEGYPL